MCERTLDFDTKRRGGRFAECTAARVEYEDLRTFEAGQFHCVDRFELRHAAPIGADLRGERVRLQGIGSSFRETFFEHPRNRADAFQGNGIGDAERTGQAPDVLPQPALRKVPVDPYGQFVLEQGSDHRKELAITDRTRAGELVRRGVVKRSHRVRGDDVHAQTRSCRQSDRRLETTGMTAGEYDAAGTDA